MPWISCDWCWSLRSSSLQKSEEGFKNVELLQTVFVQNM
jgi:hypothetical protein